MDEAKRSVPSHGLSTLDMAYIALMAVLIAVCAWISVPVSEVPFTMQTFGVFCALGLLGGRRGSAAVLVYLLMGVVGLPVFSGFTGGLGRVLGPTGGYMIGFLCAGLVYWLITSVFGTRLWSMALSMAAGCVVYYAFGTAWYVLVYAHGSGSIGVGAALMRCVVPYLIPDAAKLALALVLTRLLHRHININ